MRISQFQGTIHWARTFPCAIDTKDPQTGAGGRGFWTLTAIAPVRSGMISWATLSLTEEDSDGIPGWYPRDALVSALCRIYAESAASTNRKDRGLTHRLSMV